MKLKKLFLAADSGGSKTVWTLINEDGDLIKEIKTRGLGAQPGTLPIKEIVSEACAALSSFGIPSAIFLSLGGPNTDEVECALCSAFGRGIPITVEREASGNAILAAAKHLGCSAVIMCGTGSVAVGDTSSGRKYSGGWGPIYGDGGSGGGMGSEALRRFLRSVDTGEDIGGIGELFSALSDGLDISSFSGRMELKRRAIAMSRRELAALAPKIYALAELEDPTAISLYREAASEIAQLALGVSEDSADFKILLCGGFFANKHLLLTMCYELLAKKSRANLIYEPRFAPIVAAGIAVLHSANTEITNELFEKLLNN